MLQDLRDRLDAAEARAAAAEAEVARLRAALEHYANKANWRGDNDGLVLIWNGDDVEGWDLARAALAAAVTDEQEG